MRSVGQLGLVAVGILALAAIGRSAGPDGEPGAPPSPRIQTEPIKASVDDLKWMAGDWFADALGGKSEEHWSRPAGGTLIGMFRLAREGKPGINEYMIVRQEGEHVYLRFKHFRDDFTTWEQDAPLTFHCITLTDREVVFDSNMQTNPKRMTYQLLNRDHLRVTVQGETDGKLDEGFAIDFRREGADAPPTDQPS